MAKFTMYAVTAGAFMVLSFNSQAEFSRDQHHITLELSVKDLEVSSKTITLAPFAPLLLLLLNLNTYSGSILAFGHAL